MFLGTTIDPNVIGQMLYGELLQISPKIRDNQNTISKKNDLEIFCSVLNIEIEEYFRFIESL